MKKKRPVINVNERFVNVYEGYRYGTDVRNREISKRFSKSGLLYRIRIVPKSTTGA